eukprot:21121-Pelagococcus_subviridis.AAC.7
MHKVHTTRTGLPMRKDCWGNVYSHGDELTLEEIVEQIESSTRCRLEHGKHRQSRRRRLTLDRASIQPSQRRRRVATEPLHRVWRPGDVHVSQGRRVVRVVIHAGTERLPSIARAAPVLAVVAAVVAAAVVAVAEPAPTRFFSDDAGELVPHPEHRRGRVPRALLRRLELSDVAHAHALELVHAVHLREQSPLRVVPRLPRAKELLPARRLPRPRLRNLPRERVHELLRDFRADGLDPPPTDEPFAAAGRGTRRRARRRLGRGGSVAARAAAAADADAHARRERVRAALADPHGRGDEQRDVRVRVHGDASSRASRGVVSAHAHPPRPRVSRLFPRRLRLRLGGFRARRRRRDLAREQSHVLGRALASRRGRRGVVAHACDRLPVRPRSLSEHVLVLSHQTQALRGAVLIRFRSPLALQRVREPRLERVPPLDLVLELRALRV